MSLKFKLSYGYLEAFASCVGTRCCMCTVIVQCSKICKGGPLPGSALTESVSLALGKRQLLLGDAAHNHVEIGLCNLRSRPAAGRLVPAMHPVERGKDQATGKPGIGNLEHTFFDALFKDRAEHLLERVAAQLDLHRHLRLV